MDDTLSRLLPPELVDIVCRMVWDLRIKEVNRQVRENIIWIYLHKEEWKYTFMVSNNRNYYSGLEWFDWIGASHQS